MMLMGHGGRSASLSFRSGYKRSTAGFDGAVGIVSFSIVSFSIVSLSVVR